MEVQVDLPDWMKKWVTPEAVLGGSVFIILIVLALAWVAWRWGVAEERMEMMQQQANVGFLQAPSTTRTVRVNPRDSRVIGVGGDDAPERVDLLIATITDRYERFRVSILRDDGTLVLLADRMVRDSNSDLRLSINSSVLPPGSYRIRIEGYRANGQTERFEEARVLVAGR